MALRELAVIGVLTGETVTPGIPEVDTILGKEVPSVGIGPCFST